MKKLLFLLFTIHYSLFTIHCFAQFDFIGRKINPNQPKPIPSSLVKSGNTIPSLDFKFDSIRQLTELKTGKGEVYPWLSPDGNRIYYTEGKRWQIYTAEKQTGQYKFSNPHLLSVNSSDTSTQSYSAWLTNDELNIYFVQSTKTGAYYLCHSTRDSINQDFSTPIHVNLIGKNIVNIIRPSFTQNLETLYLSNSNNYGTNTNVTIFNNSAENEYTLFDTLQPPKNFQLNEGTLTSDDLNYFLSINYLGGPPFIYVYKRDSMKESFTKLYYINNPYINDSNYLSTVTPYFSISNNILAFTRYEDSGFVVGNNWVLYFAYNFKQFDNIKENVGLLDYINICPNPVNQLSTISYQLSRQTHIIMDVYDIMGNKIDMLVNDEKPAGKYEIKYNTVNLKNGIYLLRITDNKIGGYKKFIKM